MKMNGIFLIILSVGFVTAAGLTLILVDEGGSTTTETADEDGWDTEDRIGFTLIMWGLLFGSPVLMCAGAAIMSAGLVNKKKTMERELDK